MLWGDTSIMVFVLNEDRPGSFRMEGFDMTYVQVQVETWQWTLIPPES